MNIVLIGMPGSGKGTQAQKLSDKLDIPLISTGDLFRYNIEKGTEIGKKVKEIIDNGNLVGDDVTFELLKQSLKNFDISKGIILDGYPRILSQYQTLIELLKKLGAKIDLVIFLKVSRQVSIKRLLARRICPACDAEYNLVTKRPRKDELCDRCRKKLIRRRDDSKEIIEKRLAVYERQTRPLVEYVREHGCLEEVDGGRSIEIIYQDILERIRKY